MQTEKHECRHMQVLITRNNFTFSFSFHERTSNANYLADLGSKFIINFCRNEFVFWNRIFTIYIPTITRSDSTPLKPVISQDVIGTAITPLLDDYLYVDKTSFVLTLLRDNPKRFFFARPRRFGKTVFLRTLQVTFDKNRQGEVILQGTDIWKTNH